MNFDFATAARIVFGPGKARDAADIVRTFGRRPFVVTGRDPQRAAFLHHGLPGAVLFPVASEPTIDLAERGSVLAKDARCDVVVAVGGGSALDAGKAIAALSANPGAALDYLEVVGRAQPLERDPLPFIAIPTTAGTGSEVTRNAVLASSEARVKASLRHPKMLARVAIVDPELTLGLPPAVTAATGLDALTQLIEPFLSSKANPFTDALCIEGIKRGAPALPVAFDNPSNIDARTDMAFASLCGGLALANAGLGAVHGFAAPIGGMFDAPHGAVCAALLPHALRVNREALQLRAAGSPAIAKYAALADIFNADPAAWALHLTRRLAIPRFSHYGITAEHVPTLCTLAAQASSMKANPIPLSPSELSEILLSAL
jgi:alcohol dehydrogenase class IV